MDQNLREQVLDRVRAEIVSGNSAPGAMYSVPSLAASLGVSTTPVREALLELSRNGLIEPMRNRGFRVIEPSLKDLRDQFDLREVLEQHAAEIVARLPERDLSALRPLADDVARAVEADDLNGYIETDRRFHRAFTEAAGNPQLTELVMNMRDRLRTFGATTRAGLERQAESVAEHYRIIDLAEAGDAKALRKLLHHHIRSWEPIVAEAYERARSTSARQPIGARPRP